MLSKWYFFTIHFLATLFSLLYLHLLSHPRYLGSTLVRIPVATYTTVVNCKFGWPLLAGFRNFRGCPLAVHMPCFSPGFVLYALYRFLIRTPSVYEDAWQFCHEYFDMQPSQLSSSYSFA